MSAAGLIAEKVVAHLTNAHVATKAGDIEVAGMEELCAYQTFVGAVADGTLKAADARLIAKSIVKASEAGLILRWLA